MSKRLVIAKVISHVKVCDDLPNYILPTKAANFVGLIKKILPNMYVKKLFKWATFPMDFIN
jgi:hypothetical protein